MFLDETGITTNLLRRYGRAPRGARVHDHAPCGRWQTSTLLAALRVTGLTAPGVFDGAIDGESFRAYIEQILVPTLQPGDIVIADNLGAHKVAGIQRALQAAGATLWYLPPYNPDLNPIELCFAKLKALVRPHAIAAARRSGRSSVPVSSTSVLTNAATIFGTAGTRPPLGHEKRFSAGQVHPGQQATSSLRRGVRKTQFDRPKNLGVYSWKTTRNHRFCGNHPVEALSGPQEPPLCTVRPAWPADISDDDALAELLALNLANGR